MASTAASNAPSTVGSAIVAFALDGRFPESEDVSSLPLSPESLSPAIEALAKARADLESEIHEINEDTKDDVASWVRNAKSVQEDIVRSKTIANDIVRQSETPDVSGKAIQDAESKVEFLSREVQYSEQLRAALEGVKHVNQLLSQAEQASGDRRILESLQLLERAWSAMDSLPVGKTCRAVKLLDIRSFELKSGVHEVLDHVWKTLVHVDIDNKSVTLRQQGDGDQLSFEEAVLGLKAYKEVQERMEQLWHNLDAVILAPRMDIDNTSPPSVNVAGNTLSLRGQTDTRAESLFTDLATVFTFLAQGLPTDLLEVLCSVMMEDVTARIVKVWLDSAIPPALKDVHQFESVIKSAEQFCGVLESHGYSGFGELKDWVGNAPMMWLAKCRATALDAVRIKLSGGIGESKPVERVEKQMVSLSEGKELTNSGAITASANDQDWDAGWGDDDSPAEEEEPAAQNTTEVEEDDGADAWGWDDEDAPTDAPEEETTEPNNHDEDDGADAWGWGDDDAAEDPQPVVQPKKKAKTSATEEPAAPNQPQPQPETREMILRETYHISSMPEPVLSLIHTILEDGATLTGEGSESNPVASAAPGLFGIPTLALALFRAISPHYYSLDVGGTMFLYNDAMYMAERLAEFSKDWKAREDLSTRARNMLRIDNDVKTLQNFANRAYSADLSTQKMVVRDLLGGTYSLMQQAEMESCIDATVARIRSMAAAWDTILARSVWCQAVGALVEAAASKIVSDVMDMPAISQDEAYSVAGLIATITELDDMFLPSRLAGRPAAEPGEEVAATVQYAPSWLRLQYLSQVLQSNLNDIRYLWFESELSLCFTAREVVELVGMSFEVNARSKEVIREITQKPHPIQPS